MPYHIPIVFAAGLAAGLAVTAYTHRELIWQEVQELIEKIRNKNSSYKVYVTTNPKNNCEIYLREMDQDGKVVQERKISVDDYNRLLANDSDRKSRNSSISEISDGGELTPTSSHGSSSYNPWTPPHTGNSQSQSSQYGSGSAFQQSRTSGFRHNQSCRPRYTQARDRNALDSSFCSYNAHTQLNESGKSSYNNDDDDLYDMPHESIPLNKLKQQLVERQRTLSRSQQGCNISSSQPEMQEVSASPIPHMYYQSSSQQSSLRQGYPYNNHSRNTSYSSSNNDFLEYERSLRDRDFDFHNMNPTISTSKSLGPSSGDTNSTKSSNYPSLSFSPRDSLESDGSWHGLSSISSELATPSESDVSTLDCDSLIYLSEGESSLTDRSNIPRPRSHVH